MRVFYQYRRLLMAGILFSSLSACSSIDYFSHLAKGQLSLLWHREDVAELLNSEDVSEDLKARLMLSQKIREFAERQLALPVGEAYTEYTDLKRRYVVWNVYAAPELSLESYTWCYPFIGCLAYRGFYEESRAEYAAKQLQEQGFDVKVGGVQAYSTLGVFDDPLLNTFMFQNEVALVELLIHEIAHRKIYIKDDTKFNENFATAVALLGAEQWYQEAGNHAIYDAYQDQKKKFQKVLDFVLNFKDRLTKVFNNTSFSEQDKKRLKVEIYQTMQKEFDALKSQHDLDSRYDKWIQTLNNAGLATLANYQELVPGFLELFEQQGRNWQAFYDEVAQLAELDKETRHQALSLKNEAH